VTRDYLTDASVLRMTRVAAELGTRVQLQVLDSLKAGEFAEISWGLRLKALRDYCARLTSQDVVMMTDATDALVVGSPRAAGGIQRRGGWAAAGAVWRGVFVLAARPLPARGGRRVSRDGHAVPLPKRWHRHGSS
jgi:hypothetical protein